MIIWWGVLFLIVCFYGSVPAKADSLILKQAQDDSVGLVISDRSTARAGGRNDPGSSLGQPLKVASLHQSLINNRSLVLNGKASAQVDTDTRITGDRLVLDMQSSALLGKKITMHSSQGTIHADRVFRDAQGAWHVKGAQYSGCAAAEPHWSLNASSAKYKDKWLSCVSPTFCIAGKPVFWLPLLAVPLHEQWRGATLLPQLSYSPARGVGLSQALSCAWSPGVRLAGRGWWYSRWGFGGMAAFTSPALSLRGWFGKQVWLEGGGQLDVSKHFTQTAEWSFGTDPRIRSDIFCDDISYDAYIRNTIGLVWHYDQSRWALTTGKEYEQHLGAQEEALVRRSFSPQEPRVSNMQSRHSLHLTYERQLPSSWPVHGSLDIGAGIGMADIAETTKEAMQGWEGGYSEGYIHCWLRAQLGQALMVPGARLSWHAVPFMQLGYAGPNKANFHALERGGVHGDVQVSGMPLRLKNSSFKPQLTYEYFFGGQQVASYDPNELGACAQVITPSVIFRHHTLRLGVAQPVVLQGRDQLPYALTYTGSSPLLPLQLTADLRGGNYSLKTKHLFDCQRMRFGTHTLTGRITHDRLQSHLRIGHYTQWYAAAKKLRNEGGLFVSCGIKWYSSRHLCWWLRSKIRYDSLQALWRALHHDVGMEYSGHCWALRAGYRQRARDVYNNTYDTYSWYLRFRFTPLGSLGISVKK